LKIKITTAQNVHIKKRQSMPLFCSPAKNDSRQFPV